MISAVHYKGKRLYQLARQGKVVERKARRVRIYQIKIIRFQGDLPYPRLYIDLECSKGTYVRSICEQLGERLGCGAHLSFLVRTKSGPFYERILYPGEIKEMWEEGSFLLLPIDYALDHLPALTVKKSSAPYFKWFALRLRYIRGWEGVTGFVRLYSPVGKLCLWQIFVQPVMENGTIIEKVFSS